MTSPGCVEGEQFRFLRGLPAATTFRRNRNGHESGKNRFPHQTTVPGFRVVLRELPSGLLKGLPVEDQEAISAVVGKPVLLSEYGQDGRAELRFSDSRGRLHFFWFLS